MLTVRHHYGRVRWLLATAAIIVAAVVSVSAMAVEMPERGIVAHRGAMATHPENTLTAFQEAIDLGAQQIEFDVLWTKDQQAVVIHDETLDRTTNGTGFVSDFTLAEIKQLDAGSWKGAQFAGEQVPTLAETLAIMPNNIWLNVHLQLPPSGGYDSADFAEAVANIILESGREDQAFLAARGVHVPGIIQAEQDSGKNILIGNMDTRGTGTDYVDETIDGGFDFIQFSGGGFPLAQDIQRLKDDGVRINFYGTDDPATLTNWFNNGIEFPLVDDLVPSMSVAQGLGIEPWNQGPRPVPSTVLVNQWKLDETNGAVAIDAKGNQNGTLANSPTWVPAGGQIDGALDFERDNNDQYVDVGTATIPTTGDWTIMAWVKAESFDTDSFGTSGQNVILSQYSSADATDARFSIGVYSGDGFTAEIGVHQAATGFGTTGVTANTDQWYHVAFVMRGSEGTGYVDGVPAFNLTGMVDLAGYPTQIGARSDNTSFDGLIDDVRIYRMALTAAEIGLIMEGQLLSGDFNEDGTVDGGDLSIWQANFGMAENVMQSQGDGDADGDVDGQDFLAWQREQGQTFVSGAASLAVPEPGGVMLMVSGLLKKMIWRKKRSRR